MSPPFFVMPSDSDLANLRESELRVLRWKALATQASSGTLEKLGRRIAVVMSNTAPDRITPLLPADLDAHLVHERYLFLVDQEAYSTGLAPGARQTRTIDLPTAYELLNEAIHATPSRRSRFTPDEVAAIKDALAHFKKHKDDPVDPCLSLFSRQAA